jgi:energy-coupling factor transport system permease protein
MDLLRSLPIGLYLEQPVTWLHKLDSRIKLGWLMTFLITPILANTVWRLLLVVILVFLTLVAGIPMRAWKQQMGWLLVFCFLVFALSSTLPDGLAVNDQPRLPQDELAFSQQAATLPPLVEAKPWYSRWSIKSPSMTPDKENHITLPQPTDYKYVLFQQGPINVTRRALDMGIRVSTLFFTVVYSTTLYLLTTASEEITAAIEELMKPLGKLGLPVTEIALTLTLSLRFIPLVLEELGP